jgi:AAA+ superfamily predicted ATPase
MADDNNTSTKWTSNTTRRRRSVKDIPADQISTPVSEEMEQPSREVEPSAEEIASSSEEREYLSMLQHLRSEFSGIDPAQQQNILYNLINDRVYWRIIYYMRRFPERLTNSSATYTDRCVGGDELAHMMGYRSQEIYSIRWLDNHHVPQVEDAVNHIQLLNDQIEAVLSTNSSCPILQLMRNFSLTSDELEILGTLIAAMHEDALLRLMTVAWADFSVRIPTASFLCHLLSDTQQKYDDLMDLLADGGTLRKMRLIIAEKHAAFPNYTPLAHTPFSVEQTVIDAYTGRVLKQVLPPNMTMHTHAIPRRALMVQKSVYDELEYALGTHASRLCLVGVRHSGRRTLVCSAALQKNHHKPVLEVDATREFERLPSHEIDSRLASMMRDAMLAGAMLMLRFDGLETNEELLRRLSECQSQLERLVSFYPGEIVLLTSKTSGFFDDVFQKPLVIHVDMPDVKDAEEIWKRVLTPYCPPEKAASMAATFARDYTLPIGTIFGIVKDAAEIHPTDLQSYHILNEIRKSFRHQLASLAEISVSDIPLSGVVLPPDAKAQVNEIIQYANNLHKVLDVWGLRQRSPYGNALSALFAGPPGTGKTLLANALANELGKVLYRVDLSRIVDKYIGETEKNLGKIFDEASKAQAIILFDEADSLFAKRTEVKSSNDRYANLEINYLLQKLESYNGITILTTNLSKSIDEAFRRRIRFIIDFPMPDVPARVELWKRMMPPNAPLSDDIRWQWLAKTFEMSGGYIRNAVLKASIAAAAADKPISMDDLATAASAEARSMGKLMRIENNYDNDDVIDGYYDSDA